MDLIDVTVMLPETKLGEFYTMLGALLTGTAPAAIMSAPKAEKPAPVADKPADMGNAATTAEAPAPQAGDTAQTASADDGTLDAAGWPWSADMHASTKGLTKEGLWRMKVGVSRPAAKEGSPKESPTGGTGTAASTESAPASSTVESQPATSTDSADEDEFAAFAKAANKSGETDAAAAAAIPARKWTDADLGALCNQAATKLNDPAPVRAVIAQYVPADAVQHSRMVPQDQRAAFAAALEAAAGIEFAG